MIYINRKDDFGNLETVDEFKRGRKYAKEMLKEYRLSDSSAYYYMSQRSCKDWQLRGATMKTRSHKSIIGQLRKKYGLKDNTPIHKVEQIMTPEDWQAFSMALTFPNGKPTQRGK